MFWKKKKTNFSHDNQIILGMIMLKEENSTDIDVFIEDYNNNFSSKIEGFSGDNAAMTFTVDGESVVIAHMLLPIPLGDIEETSRYAYNWLTALEDLNEHKSHLIVSTTHGGKDQIKRFKIFTQVLSSLLRTTT